MKLQFAKEYGRFHDLAQRSQTPPSVGFGDPDPGGAPGGDWGGKMDQPF